MVNQDAPIGADKTLESIIEKMQTIQKRISSGSQPASMHELDELKKLGQQYAKAVEVLQRER
jgi:hypothetical protein